MKDKHEGISMHISQRTQETQASTYQHELKEEISSSFSMLIEKLLLLDNEQCNVCKCVPRDGLTFYIFEGLWQFEIKDNNSSAVQFSC